MALDTVISTEMDMAKAMAVDMANPLIVLKIIRAIKRQNVAADNLLLTM